MTAGDLCILFENVLNVATDGLEISGKAAVGGINARTVW